MIQQMVVRSGRFVNKPPEVGPGINEAAEEERGIGVRLVVQAQDLPYGRLGRRGRREVPSTRQGKVSQLGTVD